MGHRDTDPQDPIDCEPDETCRGCEQGCPDCMPSHRTVWFWVPTLPQDVAAWLDSELRADLQHIAQET